MKNVVDINVFDRLEELREDDDSFLIVGEEEAATTERNVCSKCQTQTTTQKYALYGEFSLANCQRHWIDGQYCPNCQSYFAFRVWNTWVRLEELLKSGNERHGITKVKSYVERLVLSVLSHMCTYWEGANQINASQVTYLLPHPDDEARLAWLSGTAVGFYIIKRKGTPYSRAVCDNYHLDVLDMMYVRKSYRRRGVGLQMLQDFLSREPENLGISNPLSTEMLNVLAKCLQLHPEWKDYLWEVTWTGAEGYRQNIWMKLAAYRARQAKERSKNISRIEPR